MEIRGLLRGQNAESAESREVAGGVTGPSPSLCEEGSMTGSTNRSVELRGFRTGPGEVRVRPTRYCSSLCVRLNVLVLVDELEVRDDGNWRVGGR